MNDSSEENKIVSIGSDHRGVEFRAKVAEAVKACGFAVDDHGAFSTESCDYPDVAATVARQVSNGNSRFGILACGSGIGMSIAANKIVGVRAALCCSLEAARLSRQHNNANVLCLGVSQFDDTQLIEIIKTWLTTDFEGGRHARRIEKVAQLESDSRP